MNWELARHILARLFMKRNALLIASGVMALVAVVIFSLQFRKPEPKPVNLLLITMDTTRADRLGCYGWTNALTPALDALAARGILFERAYTPVPVTLPAHATILTGRLPPEHGVRSNGKDRLADSVPVLAEMLRGRGYRTGAFVSAPVLASVYGLPRGFELYDEPAAAEPGAAGAVTAMMIDQQALPYRPGDATADAALRWLDAVAANAKTSPFFAWVHFYDPHPPYHRHIDLFGDRFGNDYDAEVAFMDRQISRLAAWLRERGLEDRTLVVAVADHGEGLGDHGEGSHGYFVYNTTLRVPLLAALPGRLPAGVRMGDLFSLADVLPLTLRLLGIARPAGLESTAAAQFAAAGYSNAVAASTNALYGETLLPWYNFGWAPLYSMTTREWKYIRAPRRELYNLLLDPSELDNLIDQQPELAEVLEQRLVQAEKMMRAVPSHAVALGETEQRQLASLGYLTGGQSGPAPTHAAGSIDVKDMTAVIDQQSQIILRLQRGDMGAETLAMCRQVVQASPQTAIFHGWLGMLYNAQGQPSQAAAAYETALRLAPDEPTIHNNYAKILAENGRLEDAITHFEAALNAQPFEPGIRHNLALAGSDLGLRLGQAGNFTGAVERLRRAVELQPDLAEAQHNLGVAYMRLGRVDDAIAAFEAALKVRPDYESAQHNLGIARRTKAGQP